jgi:hypothetical protein
MSEGFLVVGEAIDEIHQQTEEQNSATDKGSEDLNKRIA